MCTAQVLLLNRDVMRRNFGGDVNRRVCRKLFESNEPNATNNASMFLKKMQEDIRKRDTERWNFDFVTETPLPGRYQWEPVFAAATSNSNIKKQSTTEPGRTEPIVEELRSEMVTPATALKRKRKSAASSTQHKITDFMTKRKKHCTEESSMPSSSKLKSRRVNSRNIESLATTTRLR